MLDERARDVARQAANVAGALFQVGVTTYAGTEIQAVADEGNRSLVEPALYAFAIWGLIFALSLAYAGYQALPSRREDPLLRRVGWFTAPAFAATGLWSVFVPNRQYALAQTMLLAIFACLVVAFLRLVRGARAGGVTRAEGWLVAAPIGVFLGWVTAANAVSLTAEGVRRGLVEAGGTGEIVLGTLLLLLGGAVAAALVLAAKGGPAPASLAYAGTVLWALTGIVAKQYDDSLVTTGAAVAGAALVVSALLGPSGFPLPRRRRRTPTALDAAV